VGLLILSIARGRAVETNLVGWAITLLLLFCLAMWKRGFDLGRRAWDWALDRPWGGGVYALLVILGPTALGALKDLPPVLVGLILLLVGLASVYGVYKSERDQDKREDNLARRLLGDFRREFEVERREIEVEREVERREIEAREKGIKARERRVKSIENALRESFKVYKVYEEGVESPYEDKDGFYEQDGDAQDSRTSRRIWRRSVDRRLSQERIRQVSRMQRESDRR
jgi:hypothetical protein